MFIHSPSYTNGFIIIFIHVYNHHCLHAYIFIISIAYKHSILSSRCVYKINAVVLNIYYYNHNLLYVYVYLYIYKHECLCYTVEPPLVSRRESCMQTCLKGWGSEVRLRSNLKIQSPSPSQQLFIHISVLFNTYTLWNFNLAILSHTDDG